MPKVHMIAEITEEGDYLPFFFHQYEAAIEAIGHHVDDLKEDEELRDRPLVSLSAVNDAQIELEKALIQKAYAAFQMEYQARGRTCVFSL
jgi:hypothetical protein